MQTKITLIIDNRATDYASAARAVATPEAGAFFEALTAAGGTFTGLFSKIETP